MFIKCNNQTISWNGKFKNYSNECNRIRVVIDTSNCHYDTCNNPIFTENSKVSVDSFLLKVDLVDSLSGFDCFCSGYDEIELLKDENKIGGISIPHGRQMRFESLKDLGDAVLTEESAAFITRWLYDRNHNTPYRMFIHNKLLKESMAIKKACLTSLIGDKKAAKLKNEEDYWKRIDKIMKKRFSNVYDAGYLCFRLLGCNTKYWIYYTYEENILNTFLEYPRNQIENTIEKLVNDSLALEGITRWFFTKSELPDSNITLFKKVWKPVIRCAAKNNIEANRLCAINCLEKLRDSIPFEYIECYTSNVVKSDEERTEEEMLLWIYPYLAPFRYEHPKEYSDKAILAKIIERTKNKKSIPLLGELIGKAPQRDKKAILEIINKIE